MEITAVAEQLRKFEIPGRVTFARGSGGLPKINITTGRSTAEIYLHGAHVTGFQKNGEPPLLFMSAHSHFAAGEPLRGGVPICFPWFGPRAGQPAHGLARIRSWELAAAPVHDDAVTVRLHLPPTALPPEWSALRTEFIVTVAEPSIENTNAMMEHKLVRLLVGPGCRDEGDVHPEDLRDLVDIDLRKHRVFLHPDGVVPPAVERLVGKSPEVAKPGDRDADIFEVVLAGTFDDDIFHFWWVQIGGGI